MAPIGTQLYFLAGYHLPGDELRSLSVVHVFDTSAATDADAWRTYRADDGGRRQGAVRSLLRGEHLTEPLLGHIIIVFVLCRLFGVVVLLRV